MPIVVASFAVAVWSGPSEVVAFVASGASWSGVGGFGLANAALSASCDRSGPTWSR